MYLFSIDSTRRSNDASLKQYNPWEQLIFLTEDYVILTRCCWDSLGLLSAWGGSVRNPTYFVDWFCVNHHFQYLTDTWVISKVRQLDIFKSSEIAIGSLSAWRVQVRWAAYPMGEEYSKEMCWRGKRAAWICQASFVWWIWYIWHLC